MKGECIICRKNGVELSDEHIIPDALGGVLHSYRVCTNCNSSLGQYVDPLLLGHIYVKFERFLKKIPGKSGTVPNPFDGTHEDDNGRKYRLENNDGRITPRLIPVPKIQDNQIEILVDACDVKLAENIRDKIIKRNKLTIIEETKELRYENGPVFNLSMVVDLEQFKLAMLKIAYEFAVEKVPAYYNDETAKKYSSILEKHDLTKLNDVVFLGNGIFGNELAFLSDFVDNVVDNKNCAKHILLLINLADKLYCYVSLFDKLKIGVLLSSDNYVSIGNGILCINDTELHKELTLSLLDALSKCKSLKEYTLFTEGNQEIDDDVSEAADGTPVAYDKDGKRISLITSFFNLNDCSVNHVGENVEEHVYTIDGECFVLCKEKGLLKLMSVKILYVVNLL